MFFFVRLLLPRPTFMQDMTVAERDAMQRHVAYWAELAQKRKAVAFGPVAGPHGGFGVGIVEVESEAELQGMIAADPANALNRYEVSPMPRAIARP